jgi:Flp pilus assembly pilin Flp
MDNRNPGRQGTMKARRGISFLEYALLAALVGIVGAVGVMKYGKSISNFFSALGDKTAEVTPKSK